MKTNLITILRHCKECRKELPLAGRTTWQYKVLNYCKECRDVLRSPPLLKKKYNTLMDKTYIFFQAHTIQLKKLDNGRTSVCFETDCTDLFEQLIDKMSRHHNLLVKVMPVIDRDD